MYDRFFLFVESIIGLADGERALLRDAFRPVSLKKNGYLVEAGQRCTEVAFMVSGKLRVFHFDGANEVTCYFAMAGSFITSFPSFIRNKPSNEYIQAVEDSVLLVVHRDELERITLLIPQLQLFRRILTEEQYIAAEKRIEMLQTKSGQERYDLMMRYYPEVILSFPLQHIASYLGITPQHLSRLRKNR
ncbi:Crp/Fnr family transcriptional regulator [uncultured Acetobacteroides sp.]|uniref:Crp/Fnr family transcriptional regulator n=1 Tax=uncultured Acetobacteroides sp. TaxID=1760811 RepID=UPI0029F46213|nr:Crp/Fnr family transcriptional regulator [uncultured Acetobacteroides sp.]